MKKLQLYKDASDLAFTVSANADQLTVSQLCNSHFIESKFDSRDYPYWLQCFNQCRQQFNALNQQPALSAVEDMRKAAADKLAEQAAK